MELLGRELTNIMLKLGFRCNHKGYIYLRDILCKGMGGEKVLPLNEFGYTYIAKKYNTTNSCVEKNIDNAISFAWMHGDFETQYDIFRGTISPDKGKPTNKQFLMTIFDYLCE